MIPIEVFIFISMLVFVAATVSFVHYVFENLDEHGRNVFQYTRHQFLILPLISVITIYTAYDFYDRPRTLDMTCDVEIKNNVAFVYFDGRFINLNQRFHRNFNDSTVNITYIDPSYRSFMNIISPSGLMIQKVD